MDIPKPDGPDQSIALRMLASCWIMYGIALIVLIMRLLAKLRVNARLEIDDWLMTLSMICGLLFFGLNTVGTTYGLGRHFYYLTPYERVHAMKMEFAGQPPGILCPTFGRISFAFFLLNFTGPSRGRRWFLYGFMIQHAIINVLTIILIVVQCPNFATMWDPVGHPGVCWSPSIQANFGYFQGATNTLSDLILTIMPAFIVWNLQIERKLKIGLCALLGLSFFAMIVSIIRTKMTSNIADRSDFTYNTVDFIIWCSVENCIVIIAASIPMLRALFVSRVKPSSSNSNSNSRSTYEMHNNSGNGYEYPQQRGVGRSKSHIMSRSSRGYGPQASEEDILPVLGRASSVNGGGGIAKSTTHMVAYDARSVEMA